MSGQPWFKLPVSLRGLAELSGNEAKLWLAYRSRTGKNENAWPTNQQLSEDTGIAPTMIGRVRASLIQKGWLWFSGFVRRKDGTLSGVMKFDAVVPGSSHTVKAPPSKKNAVARNKGKFIHTDATDSSVSVESTDATLSAVSVA